MSDRPAAPAAASPRRLVRRPAAVVVLALACLAPSAQAHRLGERQALGLLMTRLRQDRVYAHRLRLDCMAAVVERFDARDVEFALREKHDRDCGGDPATAPVVDRYRIGRASGRIAWFDVADARWRPYRPAAIR